MDHCSLRGITPVICALALVACGKSNAPPDSATAAEAKLAGAEAAPPELARPAAESALLEIVAIAQRDAGAAENDMQVGGVKARRDKQLCQVIRSLSVSDWHGEIESIDSNSDGKGVLAVRIGPGVLVKTWNNELSDMGSNTLIEPGSTVFETASRMKRKQRVIFSGNFFSGQEEGCLNESSLTLRGKVKEPEFIFRFTEIKDYESAKLAQARQRLQASRAAAQSPAAATVAAAAQPATKIVQDVSQLAAAVAATPAPGVTQQVAYAAQPNEREAPPVASSRGGTLYACDTMKHQIVIDKDAVSGLVRYRAWNRPKDKDQKPDLEVKPGEITTEGTGPCRGTAYRFKTGNVGLELSDNIACGSEKTPDNAIGELTVFVGGEAKSHYWCLR